MRSFYCSSHSDNFRTVLSSHDDVISGIIGVVRLNEYTVKLILTAWLKTEEEKSFIKLYFLFVLKSFSFCEEFECRS